MGLPSGYTELEYVVCTGHQWFDAGFIPNQDTDYDVTFMPDAASADRFVFGARESKSLNRYELFVGGATATNKVSFGYGAKQVTSSLSMLDAWSRIGKEGRFFFLNKSGLFVSYNSAEEGTFAAPTNLCIAALNWNGAKSYLFIGKLGRLLFRQIADFVPAKRDSDDVAGFYDTIRNTFYKSDTDTDFLPGPEANKPQFIIRDTYRRDDFYRPEFGGIAFTEDENPTLMAKCYELGWAAHQHFMTVEECEAVTSVGANLNSIVDLTKFRFFKNVTFSGSNNAFDVAKKICFPPRFTFPQTFDKTNVPNNAGIANSSAIAPAYDVDVDPRSTVMKMDGKFLMSYNGDMAIKFIGSSYPVVKVPVVEPPVGTEYIGSFLIGPRFPIKIIIPDTVVGIGQQSFVYRPVLETVFPASVQTIGPYNFSNAGSGPFIFLGNTKLVNNTFWQRVPKGIYVPDELVDTYKGRISTQAIKDVVYPLSEYTGNALDNYEL